MRDPLALADLLGRYYTDEPPTTAELVANGVTPDDMAEVLAMVELDLEVQRSATVAAAQQVALAMTRFLTEHPEWGR